MPKEKYPSSFVCDCGYESHHFENTIKELKKLSFKKKQRLGSDDDAHTIVFDGGKMIAMLCPQLGVLNCIDNA
jgi:hypothetical protein